MLPRHAALALRSCDAVVLAALKGRPRDVMRHASGLYPLNVALEAFDRSAPNGYSTRAVLAVLSARAPGSRPVSLSPSCLSVFRSPAPDRVVVDANAVSALVVVPLGSRRRRA